MSKAFVIAVVRANGTRWNVALSDSGKTEVFVGKAGALGWLETCVATGKPVQAICYHPGSDRIEESWFFEGGGKRKLTVIT